MAVWEVKIGSVDYNLEAGDLLYGGDDFETIGDPVSHYKFEVRDSSGDHVKGTREVPKEWFQNKENYAFSMLDPDGESEAELQMLLELGYVEQIEIDYNDEDDEADIDQDNKLREDGSIIDREFSDDTNGLATNVNPKETEEDTRSVSTTSTESSVRREVVPSYSNYAAIPEDDELKTAIKNLQRDARSRKKQKKLIANVFKVLETHYSEKDDVRDLNGQEVGDLMGEAIDEAAGVAATYGDIIAIADAISQNIEAGEPDPTAFLTTSNWAVGPGVIVSLLTLGNFVRCLRYGNYANVQEALQAAFTVMASGTSSVGWVMNTVGAGGAGVGQGLASGGGIALNLLLMKQNATELMKMQTVRNRYNFIEKTFGERLPGMDDETLEMYEGLKKRIRGKLGQRQLRAGVGFTGASFGLGGGIYTTVVVVGGANAWNPAGWALFGVATVAGLGLLTHRIGRYVYTKRQVGKKRKRGEAIPAWVSTTGQWNRFNIADLIIRTALNDPSLEDQKKGIGTIVAWILLGERIPEDASEDLLETRFAGALLNGLAMGHAGIMAFIKG